MPHSVAEAHKDYGTSELEGANTIEAPGATDKLEGSDYTSDDSVNLDEFDLAGFTKEEVSNYNAIAEPGQRLQDAVTPKKMRQLMRDSSSKYLLYQCVECYLLKGEAGQTHNGTPTPSKIPSIPKQVAMFVRKHPFLEQVVGSFTKSDRRKFERDVYDYAEALGLDHPAAKRQVIKARGFCGEEKYDSDNSALGEEKDDSADILKRLSAVAHPGSEVLPSVEDRATGQVSGQAKKQPKAKRSPKKSPYFSSLISTAVPSKKRKADQIIQQSLEEPERAVEEGKRSKRKKKKNVEGTDDKIAGHVSEVAPDEAANDAKKARKAEKAAKKARKAHKRGERNTSPAALKETAGNALEPKTEAQAHENFLRSNQQDPHEHGQTLDKTEEERTRTAKEGSAFMEKLRGDIRFENKMEIDRYKDEQLKHERKEVKDDVENLKVAQETPEEVNKRVKEKKHKKRKSAVEQADAGGTPSTEKSNGEPVESHQEKSKARAQAQDFF